jgi:hypothetical protein
MTSLSQTEVAASRDRTTCQATIASRTQQPSGQTNRDYVGGKARFTGILEKQLIVPSWDAMGGATEETEVTDKFLQIVNQSVAAGSSESFGVIANRTRCKIATSLYSSIAFNALASSNKLLPAARRVKSGSPVSGSPESGGGRGRGMKSGATLLAVATRVEAVRAVLSQEVRQAEKAASSRAAAAAGAQQLLAQATMIVDSSAGLLLLAGAVASAGAPSSGSLVLSSGFPSSSLEPIGPPLEKDDPSLPR